MGAGRLPLSLSLPEGPSFVGRYCGAASMHRRWNVFLGHLLGSSESGHFEVAALADLCFLSGSQKVLTFVRHCCAASIHRAVFRTNCFSLSAMPPLGATGTIPWCRPVGAGVVPWEK